MKKYGKYKDSGVEWIGEIPEHWEVKKFNQISYMKGRIGWQGLKQSEFTSNIDEPFLITGMNFKDGQIRWDEVYHITENRYEQAPEIQLKNNDVLITKDETIGKMLFIEKIPYPHKASLNSHSLVFRPFNKCYKPKYLYYQLQSFPFKNHIELTKTGTTFFGISQDAVGHYKMLLPSNIEQCDITNYLDRKTAEIDDLIAKKEQLLKLYEEEKAAIINKAVTKGINPDVKLKDSGIEWLGEIPVHWKVKRLRYVGNCQNGVSQGADYFGSGFPFVSYSDVYRNFVLPQQVEGLAKSTESDRANFSVKKGDVFFTRTSETIEEIGLTSTCFETIENAIFAGFLIRFRPFLGLLFEGFSKYYFRSQLHRLFFVKEMNLVTRASLSQELLKKMPVILPPIQEQNQIASYLDQEANGINSKIKKTKNLIELQKEYRTALISEVVTGKIKV